MSNFNLAVKLKEARQNAGLTQKQVYKQLGVVQSTFSSWEIGKAEPDAETLVRLCKIYGISNISYFIDEDNNTAALGQDLTLSEQAHIFNYRKLSKNGREKVDIYTTDLVDSGKYTAEPGRAEADYANVSVYNRNSAEKSTNASLGSVGKIIKGKAVAYGGLVTETEIDENTNEKINRLLMEIDEEG